MRATLRLATIVAASGTLLTACVPQPVAPPPAPAPAPVARPVPPPPVMPVSSDWRDWPLTPGTWTYRRDDRGSIALFGVSGNDARMTLRCDLDRRQVFLSVVGSTPAALTFRTTSLTRAVPMQPAGGSPAYVAVALAPNDGLLDAMAFSRGRFVVQQPGGSALVVPAWAEIGRVTEDCRG